MAEPLRILLFSSLYPSGARPIHGIFVETRLRELLKTGEVQAKVVAPVPWFPLRGERFGEYARFAATPRQEQWNGVEVHHPRFLVFPGFGMSITPFTMALGAWRTVRRLQREGFEFDLIDAHYYYPDGVAASLLARWLRKPFVVTARGTDLNLIPEYTLPRKLIMAAERAASASIGVCQALMDRLRELGGDPGKTHTLRNGVDLQRFVPEARDQARVRLGLPIEGRMLLCVGHLIERKGQYLAIEALAQMPVDVRLVLAGEGPDRAALERQASALGVRERVQFAGVVPQTELKWWYSAADALALCSSREGWANVLLEAMACGTPVIATDIWGTPEVVSQPAAGVLMRERTGAGLAEAWQRLFANLPERAATRRHAETFSWESTTQGQLRLFQRILADQRVAHREA
ncbi:glycosyltransferase family 4 protein [Pseudorhodoferax sp. Leaf267]|uniref:glycosyltransferase family 4 protein n=1 Tax=Pseudorhodoferax sp. Leaf267 TaxID=1736316 RepID=UPI0009E68DF9|nr:glycosyltransferase family 4 protein [Pseudorhodoferax sp. Leaf267]